MGDGHPGKEPRLHAIRRGQEQRGNGLRRSPPALGADRHRAGSREVADERHVCGSPLVRQADADEGGPARDDIDAGGRIVAVEPRRGGTPRAFPQPAVNHGVARLPPRDAPMNVLGGPRALPGRRIDRDRQLSPGNDNDLSPDELQCVRLHGLPREMALAFLAEDDLLPPRRPMVLPGQEEDVPGSFQDDVLVRPRDREVGGNRRHAVGGRKRFRGLAGRLVRGSRRGRRFRAPGHLARRGRRWPRATGQETPGERDRSPAQGSSHHSVLRKVRSALRSSSGSVDVRPMRSRLSSRSASSVG
jgi:hypothetical protein